MNTTSKQASILLGAFAMVAIVTLVPHVFAQSTSSGDQIALGAGGDEPSTTGSDPIQAYSAGIAVIGIMTGIGVWTAVRRH